MTLEYELLQELLFIWRTEGNNALRNKIRDLKLHKKLHCTVDDVVDIVLGEF